MIRPRQINRSLALRWLGSDRFLSLPVALRVLVAAVLLPLSTAQAQVSISAVAVPVTESFDSLASAGTSSVLPTGWALSEAGTNANTSYTAGTGSGNAGDTYSFGAAGSSERAFGTLLSGSLTPTLGAQFVNNTGLTLTELEIAYTGEQWRLGATGRADRLDFQYSLDATSLSTGTWQNVDALDFSSVTTTGTVGARDGNDPQFRQDLQTTLTGLSLAPGATFWLRWTDFNASGADDGLAVDDFSLTGVGEGDAPPDVSSTSPQDGASDVALTASLTITFTEAVSLSMDWLDLTCSVSGTHLFSTGGSGSVYTADPSAAFAPGEQCEVTIFASEVTDLDGDATPMLADHVFSFTTEPAAQCGAASTPIASVQGDGTSSPLSGSPVTVEGIVVGDFQGSAGLGGFFIQSPDGAHDGDPATSEGLFVYQGNTGTDVALGDLVRVSATVTEYFELTELTTVTDIDVCGSGQSVTASAVSLPAPDASYLERYEGMLVTFEQTLFATEHYDLGRYGEVLLSANGRLFQPTHLAAPGAAAQAQQTQNELASVQLDDGSNVQNPPIPPYLAADDTLRLGDTVAGLTGVLSYAFEKYEVHPTGAVQFTRANSRLPAPPKPATGVRVASYNVLNYFTTLDTGPDICGPDEDQDCRGADSASEFSRQRAKILAALSALDADVLGLIELENNPSESLEDLVSGLNDELGAGSYDFIDTGTIGTDAIKVGILYKPSRVEPVGSYAVLDSTVDPNFIDTRNRPVLAQTFLHPSTNETFTVAVNHLKSKGSACSGDPDLSDGQGNCNLTRTAAAVAEAEWLAGDPTGSNDPDFLIIGDLNAYAMEDPIAAFTSQGFTNLLANLLGEDAYSYVFEGQAGYLDHALATSSLAAKVSAVHEWHINADEPRILDYNQEFNPAFLFQPNAQRSADHDPVIVDFGSIAPVPLPRGTVLGLGAALLGACALLGHSRRKSKPCPHG